MTQPQPPQAKGSDYQAARHAVPKNTPPRSWTPLPQTPPSESHQQCVAQRSNLRLHPAPRRSKLPVRTDRPTDAATAPETQRPPLRATLRPEFLVQFAAAANQKPLARIRPEFLRAAPSPR